MADTIFTYKSRIPVYRGGRIPYFNPIDEDAEAFLNAAAITDATIIDAINTFVVGMKSNLLWNEMIAIYPFVGGTTDTHKWNLKDPRDLDAAYRLTFTGGFTHSSTGCLPGGTNSEAETYINPSLHLSQNDTHLSYYSRTTNSKNESVEIGLSSGSSLYLAIQYQTPAGGSLRFISNINNTGLANISVSDSNLGHYLSSRLNSTQVKKYENGSLLQTANLTSAAPANATVKLFRNQTTERNQREAAFVSIGNGLTDAEVATFTTLVQNMQTSLSRQV
jgi:hypothetical protein